jgi:hypothetical protein
MKPDQDQIPTTPLRGMRRVPDHAPTKIETVLPD